MGIFAGDPAPNVLPMPESLRNGLPAPGTPTLPVPVLPEGTTVLQATEVRITITEISLQRDDDDQPDDQNTGWITVFDDPTGRQVDLLALQQVAALLTVAEIPAGEYHKARLDLRPDASQVCFAGDASSPPRCEPLTVPSGHVDVVFHEGLEVPAGGTVNVVFDLILLDEHGIHIVQAADGSFILRPVVRVEVVGAEEHEAEVEGTVVSVDCAHSTMTVDAHGTTLTVDLSHLPTDTCSQFTEGTRIEVEGTISTADRTLIAREIQLEESVASAAPSQ